MKRFLSNVVLLLLTATTSLAQENYNMSVSEKHRIVTGSIEINKPDCVIFANALLWAVERGEKYKELIEDCDFEKLRLTIDYNLVQDGQIAYTSQLTLQVSQGRLVYLVHDIKGQPSGLSSVLGAVNFDKLNPEKKTKHQTLIEDFEALDKKDLKKMFEYVRNHNTEVSKWESISEHRIEKGMSIEEVLLILGKPINIQKSAETVQYMYNTFTYVFFENGKVKSFMQ